MAFRFNRKESVARAVRRLGCERVGSALECLKDWRRAGAVHGARKDIKKVRALLRLVRTGIPQKAHSRLTRLLRKAAKRLAAPRDAAVNVQTLRNLTRHCKEKPGPGDLRHVRAALRSAAAEETRRFAEEKSPQAVDRTLRRLAKRVDRLEVRGKGWDALSSGVRTAYRQGRRAYQVALKEPSPGNLHEWRRHAKDLWYQVTLLRPAGSGRLETMASQLESLGGYLGDHHDLIMLREAVEKRWAGEGIARELETLSTMINERQEELCAAALALGARLYAEKPAAFCDRLTGYWRTWRAEKTRCHRAAEATA